MSIFWAGLITYGFILAFLVICGGAAIAQTRFHSAEGRRRRRRFMYASKVLDEA